MHIDFKKLRNRLFVAFLILYVGIIIFESLFGFNQEVITKLLYNYEDFAQPLYTLIILFTTMTGLFTSVAVISGFFLFTTPTLIILTSIGIILGIPLIFIISRKVGRKSFEEYINLNDDNAKKLKKIFKNHHTALVVLFNFVYFFPSPFGCIIGGFGENETAKLIIISIIGNLVNVIGLILVLYLLQIGNLVYLTLLLSILILITIIPLIIYRKNIRDIIKIIFKKNTKEINLYSMK
ncbi:MAG: VTT domain-containing protein [Candidatus Nanoarchaeia archaeon]